MFQNVTIKVPGRGNAVRTGASGNKFPANSCACVVPDWPGETEFEIKIRHLPSRPVRLPWGEGESLNVAENSEDRPFPTSVQWRTAKDAIKDLA